LTFHYFFLRFFTTPHRVYLAVLVSCVLAVLSPDIFFRSAIRGSFRWFGGFCRCPFPLFKPGGRLRRCSFGSVSSSSFNVPSTLELQGLHGHLSVASKVLLFIRVLYSLRSHGKSKIFPAVELLAQGPPKKGLSFLRPSTTLPSHECLLFLNRSRSSLLPAGSIFSSPMTWRASVGAVLHICWAGWSLLSFCVSLSFHFFAPFHPPPFPSDYRHFSSRLFFP